MRSVVVDASVVIKWIIAEPGREEAAILLDAYEANEENLIAPELVMMEVASALTRRVRRKTLDAKVASEAFDFLEERKPILFNNPELLREALELSLRYHLSLWDCVYLALAIRHRCALITADRRLHRAATRYYPFVSLLGA